MSECKFCKTELFYDEKRGCSVCLKCNPLSTAPVVTEKPKSNYVDVTMTEKRIREIVRDELENWHIQKPPMTRDEIIDERLNLSGSPVKKSGVQELTEDEIVVTKVNWRARAKELGIPIYDQERKRPRKKVDVLADIAEKTKSPETG